MEQPRAIEHLPPAAEELSLLVEAVEDYAIFLLSPVGEIRSWNRGAERIMGYTQNEALGQHFSIFYGPGDLEARKPQRELEIASESGRVEDEGWRVRRDGSRFWANTLITALRDPDGSLRGFAKVTRDVSARRQAEEQLRESAEIFELLVTSVSDYAIFMLDPSGQVTTWNKGAERIKGYTPAEVIGKHFSIFYTEEDRANGKPQQKLELARATGRVQDEGWRVRKDGSRFWANVIITAVYDRHKVLRGFVKVTRDITERREAEETQRALLEQREARLQAEEERRRAEASFRVAQEANRAKDEFLMTLSHELRTPMTSILGWARLLPYMPPGDPSFRDAVQSIAHNAQLQARLIDDILDVSRVVSGKLRLEMTSVDIGRLIMNAVDSVSPTADAKEISLTTSLAPALGTVVADATRLQQVVWNLLTNAVKFTPRGGAVSVTARRTPSHVQISVTDNGEGIDPRFLPHVFEPFRQAESSSTRVHGGLGLGLSIVRYIAEAHGGTVTAESEGKGRGSTFSVVLPVAVNRDDPQHQEVHAEDFPHAGRLQGLQIMLVEDELETRRMVATVLRAAGATVVAVDSAAAAMDAAAAGVPDLVITDIAMPGTDGHTLASELRRRISPELRIMALSAFPASPDSSFLAYFTKPVDPFQLIEGIADALQPGTSG